MDVFQQIIFDLGTYFNIPLRVDEKKTCKMLFNEKIAIQLQMDLADKELMVVSFVCPLPPGRFRSDVLFEALKANFDIAKPGHFAYTEKGNSLVLFEFLDDTHFSIDKLAPFLEKLYDRALEWKEAIEGGKTPPIHDATGMVRQP